MENNIKIDIVNKNDLLEKYNKEKVSKTLIEYIIKQARVIKGKQNLKIILNKSNTIEEDCKKLIIDGLKEEYSISKQKHINNNKKQVYLFILGIILLFISTLVKEDVIWKEILLISGWVPIWEAVEVELFPDIEGRLRRKIIKRLLHCQVIEKSIETENELL